MANVEWSDHSMQDLLTTIQDRPFGESYQPLRLSSCSLLLPLPADQNNRSCPSLELVTE